MRQCPQRWSREMVKTIRVEIPHIIGIPSHKGCGHLSRKNSHFGIAHEENSFWYLEEDRLHVS